jgi:crossover junction endodeoxyribonuclease RusA
VTIELQLPYPPSVNRYWRTFRGRMIVSAEGRQYRADVLGALLGRGVRAPEGELAVALDMHPPDRRRRDVDNVCKAVLDALTAAGVYTDDSVVADLRVTRRAVVQGGACVVRIASWHGDGPEAGAEAGPEAGREGSTTTATRGTR